MQLHGKASRVTIYIGEDNRHQGKPLYTALLELLRKEGAAGATVTRGLAGFGAHSRIRTANLVTLSADLPLRVESHQPFGGGSADMLPGDRQQHAPFERIVLPADDGDFRAPTACRHRHAHSTLMPMRRMASP